MESPQEMKLLTNVKIAGCYLTRTARDAFALTTTDNEVIADHARILASIYHRLQRSQTEQALREQARIERMNATECGS